jgi:hypothetical protein
MEQMDMLIQSERGQALFGGCATTQRTKVLPSFNRINLSHTRLSLAVWHRCHRVRVGGLAVDFARDLDAAVTKDGSDHLVGDSEAVQVSRETAAGRDATSAIAVGGGRGSVGCCSSRSRRDRADGAGGRPRRCCLFRDFRVRSGIRRATLRGTG